MFEQNDALDDASFSIISIHSTETWLKMFKAESSVFESSDFPVVSSSQVLNLYRVNSHYRKVFRKQFAQVINELDSEVQSFLLKDF
jgi:hypothetical protein